MKPAFLVDGVTEQKFIQSICKDRPVKIINCNGEKVSVEAIARRAASLIRLWGGRCFPVVILVDRESRNRSASGFCEDLLNAIRAEGIRDEIIVGVADRMIENWMIADPLLWPGADNIEDVDGHHGLSLVRLRCQSYDKAANGHDLLRRSRASEIARRSASFRSLFDQLGRFKCAWLRR